MRKRSKTVRKSLSLLQLLLRLFLGAAIILIFFLITYFLNRWYLYSRADRPESTLTCPDNSLPNSETVSLDSGKTVVPLEKSPDLTFFESLIKNNSDHPPTLPVPNLSPAPPPRQKKSNTPDPVSYTVQTASFQQVENAQKMVEALKKKGFSPFITPAQLSTGKTWYRVMLGNFSSREEAKRIAQKVQDSMDVRPMIISPKKSAEEVKTP